MAGASELTPEQVDGRDSLRFQPEKARAIYRRFAVEPGEAYHLRLVYRSEPDSPLHVRLVYRNGKSKPVVQKRFEVPSGESSAGWQEFERVLIAPESSASCQVVLSTSSGNLWLAEDVWSKEQPYPVTESVSPPPDEPDSEAPFWKDRPALNGFWTQMGEVAKADTTVKLGRDAENLYVLFINQEPNPVGTQRKITKRDDRVWNNDSNELFLTNSAGETRQFIAAINGTQWDGRLIQKADGDPYRADASWNGSWSCVTKEEPGRWISQWKIPFADLDERPAPGMAWGINFVRHRHAGGPTEISRWNYSDDSANVVEQFASLRFSSDGALLKRHIKQVEEAPLRIERAAREYKSLLAGQAGSVIVGDWAHDFDRNNYPKSARPPEKNWREQQLALLRERGSVGAFGPPLPISEKGVGLEALEEAHEQFGMRFPWYITTSALDAEALQNGARYYRPRPHGIAKARVVEFDPAKKQALFASVEDYFSRSRERLSMFLFFDVVDEPSNGMLEAFSRTNRPDAGKILDGVEAEIRASFGGGRFGLFDDRKPPGKDTPYERIAFVRWWNARMDEWGREVYAFLREKAPEIPVSISNHNTVSSIPYVDFPLLSIHTDWVSADPYPTAVLALYGRPRALYHTGFATKLIHDLSGGKRTRIMPQGFVYHGRSPSPEDVREWASQALKNGATVLHWYTSGPARVTIPEAWAEILKINAQAHRDGAPTLPSETRTAIYHSFISRVGLDDRVLHAQYTLYALLGERLGSWFRFVGDTQKRDQGGDLSAFDLIYVPQATYLTREAAESLVAQAERGATVVFFDPLSFQNTADGGSLADLRASLLGGSLGTKREAARLRIVPDTLPEVAHTESLPLTPVAAGIHRGSVQAFNIEPPADATIFATYEDGKPAAYSRPVGKGRILYFGAQPFGNSDFATGNPAWEGFLRALAEGVGEKTGLPIWNFYLEEEKK